MRAYSKKELLARMKRFFDDDKRGISQDVFSGLAGYATRTMRETFIYGTMALTETMQIRVSQALKDWEAGEVMVIERADGSRFAQYRDKPKPRYIKTCRLNLTDDGIKLSVGVRNKADYSSKTLWEQMK